MNNITEFTEIIKLKQKTLDYQHSVFEKECYDLLQNLSNEVLQRLNVVTKIKLGISYTYDDQGGMDKDIRDPLFGIPNIIQKLNKKDKKEIQSEDYDDDYIYIDSYHFDSKVNIKYFQIPAEELELMKEYSSLITSAFEYIKEDYDIDAEYEELVFEKKEN